MTALMALAILPQFNIGWQFHIFVQMCIQSTVNNHLHMHYTFAKNNVDYAASKSCITAKDLRPACVEQMGL